MTFNTVLNKQQTINKLLLSHSGMSFKCMITGERMRNLLSSPTLARENGREETGNRNLILNLQTK